nr:hypothetical protein CFP56_71504 [Quercus suber]
MAQRRRGRRGGIRGNQMDVGEGVEANPPVRRNVGRNQNIKREDVIAELRRQVAALTEKQQTRPALRPGQWGSRSEQWISSHYKAGNSSTNGRGETSGVEQQPASSKSAITGPKQSQTATVGGGRQQQVVSNVSSVESQIIDLQIVGRRLLCWRK